MESLQSLNRRRKAVSNIGAITKAMEVVAAIKMRKSEEVALDSRPYAFKVLNLLEKLSRADSVKNVFTSSHEIKKTLVVLITSDRGLIGSFNTQAMRAFENFIRNDYKKSEDDHEYLAVAVGKKADAYMIKRNFRLVKNFYGFGDLIRVNEIDPLSVFLTDGFIRGDWDRVVTISMHFRSALKQEALSREILPLDFSKIRETVSEMVPERGKFSEEKKSPNGFENGIEYIFEPSPKELLEELMPHLLRMEIYQLILEANASEHSARYVAMKSASDNASELTEKLLVQYNKARQASITGEIIEMSATQSALK